MSAATRQALEAGAVCFDTREHWLPGSRAPDHKHGHLTPHIVVEPTSRVIRHYGRQVFDKWVKSSRACELSMRERISAPRRLADISLAFLHVTGLCSTGKVFSVAADGAVLATFLDGADPRRADKWFASLADRLARARA